MSELDVRELAARRGDPFMVSFYADVDGRRSPRPSDLEPRIEHLFRRARAEAARAGEAASSALEADLAAIGGWLAGGLDRRQTRGLAAFSCARQGFFLGVRLLEPVPDQVALDRIPHLGALLEAQARARPSLVVLVDRTRSRLLEIEAGVVHERPGPIDDGARRVDDEVELGGFDRLREEASRRHLRRVAAALDVARAARPYAWLLLGGPEADGLASELRRAGSPSTIGQVQVAMSAPAREVSELAGGRRDELERRRQEELVNALVERAGVDACLGLEATLWAIAEGRAAMVVVVPHLDGDGWRCPACGALTGVEGRCRRCGGVLERVADLREAAIAEVVCEGGEVEVAEVAGLAAHEGLGAFLRFSRPERGGDLDA